MQALVNQCAFLLDTLGAYFLLRFLIRDEEDVARIVKVFAFIAIILGLTMTYEKLYDRNVFQYIGGIVNPHVREGSIRAAGSLSGSIQCGTFWRDTLGFVCLVMGKGKIVVPCCRRNDWRHDNGGDVCIEYTALGLVCGDSCNFSVADSEEYAHGSVGNRDLPYLVASCDEGASMVYY